MKFFPQAQMQSPPDMCTHALFILPKEKGESKGMGKYFLGLRFGVQGCGSGFAASIYEAMPKSRILVTSHSQSLIPNYSSLLSNFPSFANTIYSKLCTTISHF